jgi:multiple sugar transport system permease protein
MKNNSYKLKSIITGTLKYSFLILAVIVINLPIITMIQTSFIPREGFRTSIGFNLTNFTFSNFIHVLGATLYGRNLLNSLIVAISVSLTVIIVASLAAYALSRFKGPVFNLYSILMLLVQIFPLALIIIPLFIFLRHLGLLDNLLSLILSYMAIALPFSIWMLKAFFDTISREIEAAATIDGCSQFGTFFHIVLPLAIPGISAVGIFSFIVAWNEYMLASIFIRQSELRTLTVGIQQFVMRERIEYPLMMAAGTLAMLPALLFLIFAQKYLIQGLTSGAIKE